MENQEPHSDDILSPGGGETPHPRTGPDQGGELLDTAAENEQAEEGNKDVIEETVEQAVDSDLKPQEGHGTGQSLTAGDQKSGQAPAEGEQRPSGTDPDHAARDAMKPQEPMGNSMAPGVEDPAIGSAALKRPPGLTQIAEFWKRYDRLADIEDQKMSKNLNANLDVLLIFAALFSAINTTFISMTMPSLSPDPADRTNALLELLVKRVDNSTLTASDLTPPFSPQSSSIAINFLLYASLCCSLLAAMGAMLGKEWLQSFDRSGQTGPLEEQGRFRQRKLNGILQWHLEGTILFLPNLLLFSVTLFFAGLAVYLLPVNKVVAGLLIVVLSFSVGVWLVTVLAGAIWQLCPYQSAASRALRILGLRAASYWVQVRRPEARAWPTVKNTVLATLGRWKTSFCRVLTLRPSSTSAQPTQIRKEEVGNELRAKEEQISNAQAAFWLINTTSSWEDRAAAAEFMTTFANALGSASVPQDQGNWKRLLQFTQEAFENWHYQPSDANRKMVEIFGRALSHVAVLRPSTAVQWRFRAEPKLGQSSAVLERFMKGLETASKGMNDKNTDWELLAYATSLYVLEATGDIYTKSRSWERLFVLMGGFDFSLLNKRITYAFWNAAHALRSLPESHPETSAFEIYSTFLQEIRHVVATDQLPGDLVSLLTYSVAELIFDFNESLWANKGAPNLKSDKSLTEALLSLHAILSSGSLPTSSVRNDTQGAFEDRDYRSSSANRKIVESFGQPSSHVGLLHPQNAVKWRSRAEGEPGKLHGVLERFLKGFGAASKRMIDKDADWELLTYATSLYGLEATGYTYTKSRSWERLFVLMGDFDFNLLNKRITYAFWNAAHALRSLPESHPETSAFEIYPPFLQEIRDVVATDQLPGDLVSLLKYSVAELIFDFNESLWANKGSPNLKSDKSLTEALLSLHAILSNGSLPTSSVRDDTQGAFEDRDYRSSSANRKIVESFGRASSRVGLLFPQNAVKWRSRAEGKPGKLHGVLERFLKGFGAASKRMIDKDADWELLTYATSLYGLEATGDTYTKSRSWERLFVLMGDFDFSLLNRQVTYAFWNAAHALRSLPEPHSETSAFEIYSTFLQEIRHVATTDQLPSELVSLLTYSAVEFIFDSNESFGTNPVSPNLKLDKFSAEALLSLRVILPCCSLPTLSVQDRYRELRGGTSWRSPNRIWDSPKQKWWGEDLDNFWRALDSIITKLTESPPEIKELTVDFVLAAVEWLSISLPSDEPMSGLERFPQIPTFIALSLAEGNPARQARGLDLFLFNVRRWTSFSPSPLNTVWVEVGLVARLVEMVTEPQTWSNGTRLLEVLKVMTKGYTYWSEQFVDAGFIPAATKAILHIDKTRERLHPEWEDLLRRTLAITLEVWNDTENSNPTEWAALDTLLMVRHSSVHVEVSLNSKEEDPRDVERFVKLINHLYERRSLAAFVSCNADVAVRSLFCELRRRVEGGSHPRSNAGGDASAAPDTNIDWCLLWAYGISRKIEWNYVPYGLPEPPVLCSRLDFVGIHWQML